MLLIYFSFQVNKALILVIFFYLFTSAWFQDNSNGCRSSKTLSWSSFLFLFLICGCQKGLCAESKKTDHQGYSSFSYWGLSVNSLNSVKSKILNNYHSFTKELNFTLSEQRVLCNLPMEKVLFITTLYNRYVLHHFSFVEFSEFSENIQIGKTPICHFLYSEFKLRYPFNLH